MRTRLAYYWDLLRGSYWFMPAVMVIAAIGLSFAAVAVDREIQAEGVWILIFGSGTSGARAILSTIAGSMITVAGVVFSVTIVALSLASSQFGPRLLRTFIRDRQNQFVLGTFIATFVYCLLVLRTVDETLDTPFVPEVAVTVGLLMALMSLGGLIYFIHHVATSIQVTQIVSAVSHELLATIDALFPREIGESPPVESQPHGAAPEGPPSRLLTVSDSGYLAAVNGDGLMHLARESDLVIELRCQPGRFLIQGASLAAVWGGEDPGDDAEQAIVNQFILESQKTAFQDVTFCVEQLTEIAIRALSPGVNDPFTAVTCIDYLGVAMSRLAGREFPSPYRYDSDDRLRVIARPVSFADVLRTALDPLRVYGSEHPSVLARALEVLAAVAGSARRPEDCEEIDRHADAILATAKRSLPPEDHAAIERRHGEVKDALCRPLKKNEG